MAKYRSYRYKSIKKICGRYQVIDEKEEEICTPFGSGLVPEREVNRELVKSPDTPYVVVEKFLVADYYNRGLYDYEIYTNGVRDEIEVDGWKFPFLFEDVPVWNKGNYCHMACLSPKGKTVDLEYVDTGAVGLFESFEFISKFEDEEELEMYWGLRNELKFNASGIADFAKLREEIESRIKKFEDSDLFIVKELKSLYNQCVERIKYFANNLKEI